MGILDGCLGNATEVDVNQLGQEFAALLVAGEQIERTFGVLSFS